MSENHENNFSKNNRLINNITKYKNRKYIFQDFFVIKLNMNVDKIKPFKKNLKIYNLIIRIYKM